MASNGACWSLCSRERMAEPQISSEPEVLTVDVISARDLLNSGYRYLDVRTEEEFQRGHPEGAINIPYMFIFPEGRKKNEDFLDKVSSILGKEDAIIVGCASGVRSLSASVDLLNAGFKNAKNVGGGFKAWVEKGLAIRNPTADQSTASPLIG
ncbi:thiosulfate sulfurtransferase 16, chloroplastic-like [Wolffia australiana]